LNPILATIELTTIENDDLNFEWIVSNSDVIMSTLKNELQLFWRLFVWQTQGLKSPWFGGQITWCNFFKKKLEKKIKIKKDIEINLKNWNPKERKCLHFGYKICNNYWGVLYLKWHCFHSWVLYFVIGSSTILTFNNKYQNMQYLCVSHKSWSNV
jgi:hypothetical protein